MTDAELRASAFTPLQGEQYISLTTFRKSGEGVATPVWFVDVGGTIYLYTGPQSGKVKRVRHTARVTLAPCTMRGGVTGPTVVGSARLVTDPAEIRQAFESLRKKYGWQFRLLSAWPNLTNFFKRRPPATWTYLAITPTP